ncbi:hypothetical protein B0H14DRAFT_1699045 [Mycena olivaceomarginata]|nr:hypothetical protein B0H14DRAFT_1699045 [Mycena olivaceomarginata]
MHSTVCREFQSGGLKSKGIKPRGTLEVNLGTPFHLLLDADSDVETPSPLTLCFDFPKPPSESSPLREMSEWSDDSDSDSDSELDLESDDSQYISISSDSPFYTAHPPVAFQTTFDVPLVPFPSKPLLDDANYSEASVAQSRAELERVLPSEVKKDLFLVDEGCLRSMGDELFSTPIDAFMDVCLSRLRSTTSIPSPNSSSKSGGASAPFPKYYLASFLDLDRCDASSLDPSLRALFCKRALSARHPQAIPAAAPGVIPFL